MGIIFTMATVHLAQSKTDMPPPTDADLVEFGAFLILVGIVSTVVILKWRGFRGGGFFVPDIRPPFAILFGAVFWGTGLAMVVASLL